MHHETPLLQSYLSTLSSREDHCLIPLIDFLRRICQLSLGACEAVLESGSLDLLLHLYATDFRDSLYHELSDYARKSSLLNTCHALVMVILEYEQTHTYIRRHPILALWPIHPCMSIFLSKSGDIVPGRSRSASHPTFPPLQSEIEVNSDRLFRRWEAWGPIAPSNDQKSYLSGNQDLTWIRWRIVSIYDTCTYKTGIQLYRNGGNQYCMAFDAFLDLMEFTGW
ncbi:hypothetical protein D9758_010767 [Tetrapyrgos nigripes]|uniref:Uncharacterized protein n=1 Tax=Tetrapyrgos nigripes TaxID=182062 RepID=A0A8H5FZJ4_9AGAR|nr:hypothetical protein D9758_010767 [Tetrapyrgos nigripes]